MDLRGHITLAIFDDGEGMDKDGLINAMKYGSKTAHVNAASLGKFGLGLKTASTAFCRKLTVISKRQAQRGRSCGQPGIWITSKSSTKWGFNP